VLLLVRLLLVLLLSHDALHECIHNLQKAQSRFIVPLHISQMAYLGDGLGIDIEFLIDHLALDEVDQRSQLLV
jgi:hypothetical protein